MRANPNLQFLVIEPEKKSLNDFVQMLKQIFVNFMFVLNGHIGFGDGTNRDNVDGNWINVTTPVAPNTDFTVNHNLQRLPVGYIPMEKDRAVDIYTGSVPATLTQLTLRATVASAVVRLFIICLVLAIPLFGQSTTVNVNVTDSSSQVWIGGNYKISFWTNPSFPNGYQWQGSPFNQTMIFTGTMDGSGNFSVSIPDNSTISPTGSAWKFTVCPLATFPCFDQVIGISGTTQNINIVPSPILISPTPINSSYLKTQSKAGLGALMYQITDGHLYVCTANSPYRVNPSGACSGWVEICEVGDGLCGGGTTPISIQHNGTLVGTQPIVNLIDGANTTLTVVNNGGATRIDVTIASAGGGTGCTLSGVNLGVVSEHPLGTCFDSIKFTWDATNEFMLAGNGSSTISGVGSNTIFSFGNSSTLQGSDLYSFGSNTILKGSPAVSLGTGIYNTTGNGVLTNAILAEFNGEIDLGGPNARATDVEILGSDDLISVGNPTGPSINQANCLHGVGGHNAFTIVGGLGLNTVMEVISWVGKDATWTANGHSIQEVVNAGNSNTFNATSAILTIAGTFGNSLTLSNCTDCYAVGESVSNSTNNTLAMGMSAVPEIVVSTNQVTLKKLAFVSLPTCAAGTEGSLMPVTDSSTNTWGATVTGGSTNHVLAYCDGTNWTVAAK